MIQDYLTLALRNLRKRRLRSWLTIVGILISIATIFILISLSIGLQEAVKEEFRLLGTDKFFIQPLGQLAGPGTGGAVKLTTEDVKTVEKVNGVRDISYNVVGNAEVKHGNQKRYAFAVGLPLDKSKVLLETEAFKTDEGRLLEKGDRKEIMIGYQYKYNNIFDKAIRSLDTLTINGVEFKVKGILKSLGNPVDDKNIYMSTEDFEGLFNTQDKVDAIIIQVEAGQSLKEVAENVKKELMKFRNVNEKTIDFQILTPEELLESFGTVLNIITAFLIGVAAISLIVGAVGIANTMYTSVLERTKEIGVMKAIGARNSDIIAIFTIESGMLGLVGGVLGILMGFSISKAMESIASNQLGTSLLKAAVPLYLILGCLAFAFLIGAFSGIFPSYRASKIKPTEALRYE